MGKTKCLTRGRLRLDERPANLHHFRSIMWLPNDFEPENSFCLETWDTALLEFLNDPTRNRPRLFTGPMSVAFSYLWELSVVTPIMPILGEACCIGMSNRLMVGLKHIYSANSQRPFRKTLRRPANEIFSLLVAARPHMDVFEPFLYLYLSENLYDEKEGYKVLNTDEGWIYLIQVYSTFVSVFEIGLEIKKYISMFIDLTHPLAKSALMFSLPWFTFKRGEIYTKIYLDSKAPSMIPQFLDNLEILAVESIHRKGMLSIDMAELCTLTEFRLKGIWEGSNAKAKDSLIKYVTKIVKYYMKSANYLYYTGSLDKLDTKHKRRFI